MSEKGKRYVVIAYDMKEKGKRIIFPEPKTKNEAKKLAKTIRLERLFKARIKYMPYPKWDNALNPIPSKHAKKG